MCCSPDCAAAAEGSRQHSASQPCCQGVQSPRLPTLRQHPLTAPRIGRLPSRSIPAPYLPPRATQPAHLVAPCHTIALPRSLPALLRRQARAG